MCEIRQTHNLRPSPTLSVIPLPLSVHSVCPVKAGNWTPASMPFLIRFKECKTFQDSHVGIHIPDYTLARKNCLIIRIGCTVIAWAENVWVIRRVHTSRLLNPLHIPCWDSMKYNSWSDLTTNHALCACMITLLTASFLFRFITFINFQYKSE